MHLGGGMYDQEQGSNAMLAWRNERLGKIRRGKPPTRGASNRGLPSLVMLSVMLITIFHPTFAFLTPAPRLPVQSHSLTSRATNDSSPLECLQVAPPILSSPAQCQQTLMVHTFAYSYGQPFIGK